MIRSEISTGHLTREQTIAHLQTLAVSHFMRVDMRVLDADEKEISSLTAPAHNMLSAAVQVDTTASITRTLQATFVDKHDKLRFEANSPAHGALFADKFIAVRREVWVPEWVMTYDFEIIPGIGEWVSTPVFHGPLSNYARNGPEVSIEAQGKEALMLSPHLALDGDQVDRGTRMDDAILQIARKAGETRFDIPNLKFKLGRARVIRRETEPWLALTNAKKVAGFISRRNTGKDKHGDPVFDRSQAPGLVESIPGHWTAFYDGIGRLCVRHLNHRPSYRVTDRKHMTNTSLPALSYDITKFRNYVVVIGGKQHGHEHAEGHAALPPNHPLSPHALAHNGKPRYLVEFIHADNLTSDGECEKRARTELQRLQLEGVDLQFNCKPLPMLEENDVITAKTKDWEIDFRPRQYTIPLTSDSDMSVGYHQRVKLHKRRHKGGRAGPPGGRGGSGHHHHRKKVAA